MIYLFAAFLLILIAVLWFRTKLTEKLHTQMPADAAKENISLCTLEIPEAFAADKTRMIDSFASAAEAGETAETGLPAVYLETNCSPGSIIPLMEEENLHNSIKELFIARVTQDGPERDYMKPDSVYLCISPGKQVVSRPNENRYGHARIFHGGRDDYYLEDLGSKVGTFLNKKRVKTENPAVFQDDDAIDIGGKKGIRMVFKRAR